MTSAQPAAHPRTLLLVGGGHAHVAVLADWIRRGVPAGARGVLLTPEPRLRYSGMVPGWLAGQHGMNEGLVDLAALAARAGVEWVQGRCAALDPVGRSVTTDGGRAIAFDCASLDTGGVGRGAALLGDDPRLIDVRPIAAFAERIAAMPAPARVVVAGGGAGGVELAFALRNLAGTEPRPEIILVTGAAGLLPGFAEPVRSRVARALIRQGITVIAWDARIEGGAIIAGEATLDPVDLIVAATGSAAPAWVRESGLAVDAGGFALVDAQQRSLSHPHVFAAGDVAARTDRALAHSGVHAVKAGPVLAANLRSVLDGEAPQRAYHPRRHSLYLINTGDGSAIASYGPLVAEGRWVLALKHRIDKGWIATYAALAGDEGSHVKKIAILAALAAIVVAYFAFGLGQYLTLEGIKAGVAQWETFYADNPVLVLAAFFAIYVLVVASVFLPGAAIMTVAAGALFGLVTGTILVSFASTLGATLAFLISRYLLRDTMENRFGGWLKSINEGLERDGAFYLFSLRMIPAVPFFVINPAMGLTRIKTWTYVWVSQIGMLLGTIVYVNAGTQLARIESLSGIASPGVLGSFALLGIAPWLAKLVIGALQRRKVYAGFKRPKKFDRNMVVIGAGAAGLVSAYIAATVKAKVTLVEAKDMGGDCLNTGCVPSKALIKSAKVAAQMRHADRYGLTPAEPQVPFQAVIARVLDAVKTIEPHDSVERYEGLGVDVVKGYARIIDPWTVEIARNDGGTQRLTTRSIVIASGAEPVVPPIPGIAGSGYLTSETMWEAFAAMDAAPAQVVVLGGGPIGCELSQALARLGSKVAQVEMEDRLLGREDEDVSALAKAVLEADGVSVHTGHKAVRIEGKVLVAEHGGAEVRIPFDTLIVAVGRKARLTGFGLEDIGVDTAKTVVTDAFLATKFPNIFACGDVAGPYQFTHTASHQAWYASVNALFGTFRKFKADYRVIPAVTFLDPEFARVGLNEREAAEQGIAVEVTRYELDDLDRAIADSETRGFVKVLTPAGGKDTVLGATIVGAQAGELLAEYVLAMKHGIGLNKILGTIHAYPTMVEANKFAAGNWKKAHKPEGLLKWVERYHDWRRG